MNDNPNPHTDKAADSWMGEDADASLEIREPNAALLRDAMVTLPGTVSPTTAAGLQATENNFRELADEFGVLDAAGIAELLGAEGDPVAFAAGLRERGQVLSFPRLDTFVYPGFQCDTVNGRVKPVIAPLIELGKTYGWTPPDIATWLCEANGYLKHECRTVDVLDDANLVLKVAKDEWGVVW